MTRLWEVVIASENKQYLKSCGRNKTSTSSCDNYAIRKETKYKNRARCCRLSTGEVVRDRYLRVLPPLVMHPVFPWTHFVFLIFSLRIVHDLRFIEELMMEA